MPTKVPKTLIKSIDPSQIDSGGATAGQVLTYNGSTSTWVASAAPTGGVGGSVAAWVKFDGTRDTTDTVSTANTNRLIRASFNVSSVMRNALGDFTINFTTPLSDTNYATNITTAALLATPGNVTFSNIHPSGPYSVTAVRIFTVAGDRTAAADSSVNCVTITR